MCYRHLTWASHGYLLSAFWEVVFLCNSRSTAKWNLFGELWELHLHVVTRVSIEGAHRNKNGAAGSPLWPSQTGILVKFRILGTSSLQLSGTQAQLGSCCPTPKTSVPLWCPWRYLPKTSVPLWHRYLVDKVLVLVPKIYSWVGQVLTSLLS